MKNGVIENLRKDKMKCKAITRKGKGKKCRFEASINGYCLSHWHIYNKTKRGDESILNKRSPREASKDSQR